MADHDLETDPELEHIRHQMDETRTSLAEKIDALETKVLSPVQAATEVVSHTVEDVKEVVESVTESVQETVASVKETFNVSHHVRNHPWLTLGGAFTVGFLGGMFFLPRRREYPADLYPPQPAPRPEPERFERAASASSEEEDDGFAPLKMIKGLAIGTLMGVVREMLTGALPENLTSNVKTMVDDFTTKLGGQPITSAGDGAPSAPEESSFNGHTPAPTESPTQGADRGSRSERRRAGSRGS